MLGQGGPTDGNSIRALHAELIGVLVSGIIIQNSALHWNVVAAKSVWKRPALVPNRFRVREKEGSHFEPNTRSVSYFCLLRGCYALRKLASALFGG